MWVVLFPPNLRYQLVNVDFVLENSTSMSGTACGGEDEYRTYRIIYVNTWSLMLELF